MERDRSAEAKSNEIKPVVSEEKRYPAPIGNLFGWEEMEKNFRRGREMTLHPLGVTVRLDRETNEVVMNPINSDNKESKGKEVQNG